MYSRLYARWIVLDRCLTLLLPIFKHKTIYTSNRESRADRMMTRKRRRRRRNEKKKSWIHMEKCYRSTCFIPFQNVCIIVAYSLATGLSNWMAWHRTPAEWWNRMVRETNKTTQSYTHNCHWIYIRIPYSMDVKIDPYSYFPYSISAFGWCSTMKTMALIVSWRISCNQLI